MDISSWILMNIYIVQNHVRNVHSLCQMEESAIRENLFHIVMNNLCELGGLDGLTLLEN